MSTTQRITKLERTVRKGARESYIKGVLADFEPAIARAEHDSVAQKHLFDARNAVIKTGAKAAEDAALEEFLVAKAPPPQLISLEALYNPVTVRIAANGERLPDTATDYAAVLLPQFDLLYTVGSDLVANWQEAVKLGSEVELFDGKGEWQLWDDIEAQLTIDRSVTGPAVLPAFRKYTPSDYIFWTRRPYASSSGGAFYVSPRDGDVDWGSQSSRGRVRAVRRARASQF